MLSKAVGFIDEMSIYRFENVCTLYIPVQRYIYLMYTIHGQFAVRLYTCVIHSQWSY